MEEFKDDIRVLINLGAPICEKLKRIYYPDTPWISCHKQVSVKFTQLKAITSKFYVDRSEKEMLMELGRYSDQDIQDCFT